MKPWIDSESSVVTRISTGLVSLTLLAMLGTTGCGDSIQHMERYVRDVGNPGSSFAEEIGRFHIQLLLRGTREETPDSRDSVFFDSVAFVRAPYTLHVSTTFYGTTEDTAEIRSITMQVNGQVPVMLHGNDAAPIQLAFVPWLEHAVAANLEVPLGERLTFVDGQNVTIDVEFAPPESTESYSIRTVFRAESRTRETSKLEQILKGS